MKNPQDQLFFASGFAVVRNALANGHILTREQRLYCLHAINQHDKLVAGAAVSECNRLRDLLQTCEAANKCLSMRVDVQATDLSKLKVRNEKLMELAHLAYDVIEDDLEERPARHSLGNLSARLRTILVEEKP